MRKTIKGAMAAVFAAIAFIGLPDKMRTHGTIGDLKEAVIKQGGGDDFAPRDR